MKKLHYDKTYYDWQRKAGEYAAAQDLWKFQPYIKKTDTVLDFGCGGGYILEKLRCKKKYGVDVNPEAVKEAEERGIRMFRSLDVIPPSLKFDVIISHHSLEHLENPAQIIRKLKGLMKKNGTAVHIVPINDWRLDKKYNPQDINQHLYTWTPLLLGNLFAHCGYTVKKVEILNHMWLPLSRFYFKYAPKFIYYPLSRVWAVLTLNRQMRIVVQK